MTLTANNPLGHILVPSDGSAGSLHAAAYAGALARLGNSKVTVLVVHDLDVYALHAEGLVAWPGSAGLSTLSHADIEAQVTERVSQPIFKKTLDALDQLAHPVVCDEIWGHVAETICSYAERNAVDMVVMGSRGRSAFASVMLGSTSAQVLHHAPCPVTVVR